MPDKLLAICLIVPVVIIFVYAHATLSRLLIIRKACSTLRTWHPADGKVTSVIKPGPAAFNNPYTVKYEFATGDGLIQEGKAIFDPRDMKLSEGSCVKLLYAPQKPSLCRLEQEMRKSGILEKDGFAVKSEKRVLKELLIDALLCVICAVGCILWLSDYGTGVLAYLLLGGISAAMGCLQPSKFYSSKLQ